MKTYNQRNKTITLPKFDPEPRKNENKLDFSVADVRKAIRQLSQNNLTLFLELIENEYPDISLSSPILSKISIYL